MSYKCNSVSRSIKTEDKRILKRQNVIDFKSTGDALLKMGYNIYYKWANKFYPNAAKHLHNGKNVKPANLYINWHGMPIPVNGLPRRIIKKIREHLKLDIGMNPLDIWYYSNDSIRSAFNEYFENNINILDDYMELKKDVEKLIQSASVRDKTLAISLIGSLKYLCE